METKIELVKGKDIFTLLDLLRRAAAYKNLKFKDGGSPIKVYNLDEKILNVLTERGIKRQERPDCWNKIFTLVDQNPQEKIPGCNPTNYWNFKLLEGNDRFDLRVTLSVGFGLNFKKRGIVLVPQAHGPFVSPGSLFSHFRMFKALVESDEEEDLPTVAKELAASDGEIVVTWTELGLGGIRELSHLFEEFASGNETVKRLGRNEEIFNPAPYLYQQPGDKLFIAEPAQPKLFYFWQAQLNEYRASLSV